MTQGLPVEVLRVRRQRANTAGTLEGDILETLDELSPEDVFARRLAQEDLPAETQAALAQRFREVVKSITEGAL